MNSQEWLEAVLKVAVSNNPKKEILKLVLEKAVEDSRETREVVEFMDDVIGKSVIQEYVQEMDKEELYLWIESSGDEYLMEVLS